jgi:hypothetical protein
MYTYHGCMMSEESEECGRKKRWTQTQPEMYSHLASNVVLLALCYSATRVTPRVTVAVDVRQPAALFLTAATATAVNAAINATTPLVATLVACRVSSEEQMGLPVDLDNRWACLLTLTPGLHNERGDCARVHNNGAYQIGTVVSPAEYEHAHDMRMLLLWLTYTYHIVRTALEYGLGYYSRVRCRLPAPTWEAHTLASGGAAQCAARTGRHVTRRLPRCLCDAPPELRCALNNPLNCYAEAGAGCRSAEPAQHRRCARAPA